MIERRLPFPVSTLAVALAAALFPQPAMTADCSDSNGVRTCTLQGEYSASLEAFWAGMPVPPTDFSSTATITVTPSPSTQGGLSVAVQGSNGNSSRLTGGDTQGLTLTNSGAITLRSGSPVALSGEFYGLSARQQGGDAVSHNSDGGNGGVAGQHPGQIVSVSNQGDITVDLRGSTLMHGNGAALSAVSQGGRGAVASNGEGGAGGQAVGAKVTNTGNITAVLGGAGRFAAIQAVSHGGAGADDSRGNGNDGGSIPVSRRPSRLRTRAFRL